MKIRIALQKDAEQLLGIYRPFVTHNAVSFETEVPSVKDFQLRMKSYMLTYPWLVCEDEGKIIGYAYASRYRDRIAYQWSCECSVYVDRNYQRKGIAGALYSALFEVLRYQGFANVYAVITHPNPASIKFHVAAGFKLFAIYKKVGYKFGKWHDVHWYAMKINSYDRHPESPKPFSIIHEDAAVKNIIERHNQDLSRLSSRQ